jgi:hypothetical protein
MIEELKKIGINNYFLQNFVKQNKIVREVSEGIGTKTMLKDFDEILKENFSESGVRNLD